MKTIQIEDEIHAFLLTNVKELGEDASTILRRLLNLPVARVETQTSRNNFFSPGEEPRKPSFALEACLLEPSFEFERDAVSKFLFILSWLYKKHQNDFVKVLKIKGRTRSYFADSAQDLEETGNSVNPQKIPNSPYWVVTNNDTPKKGRILVSVACRLGYPAKDAIRLGDALEV